MTTPIPLWLKLAVLPFLAGAAFCVDYELQVRIAHFALANRGDPLGFLMVGTGKVCGPLLAAGLVAYPIARMFEKHWALACLALVLTISWFYIKTYWIDDGDPIGAAVMMTTPLLFALLVPALARGAYLWIQDSQLVLTQSRKDDTMGELVDPRALKLLLLPIFAIGLFLIHDFWQPTMHAIGFLPTTRTGDRIGLIGGVDGIAFDDKQNLYLAVHGQDRIVYLDKKAKATTVYTGAPLQQPSSLVFGATNASKHTLYISNFSILAVFGVKPGPPTPGLLKLTVPNEGLELP